MKKVLIQLAAAVIVLIVVLGGYSLWYTTVSAESAQVASLEQQIQQKSQTATRIAAAKAQLAQLDPEEQEVSQYFVSTSNIVVFLEQLSSIGQTLGANVEVESVSATSPTAGTPYGSLNLSLKITGSFQAVMRTLGAIEYGPYDIKTNSVTLDVGGQDSSQKTQWTAEATFTISTQNATQNTPLLTAPKPATATSASSAAPTQPTTTNSATASTSNAAGSASPTV